MSPYTPLTCSLIVEGHGEVAAAPILLRRVAEEYGSYIKVNRPIRLKRDAILRESELSRAIVLASLRAGAQGIILILLDSDDDCPVEIAGRVRDCASKVQVECPVEVIAAVREFESLFLSCMESLSRAGLVHEEHVLARSPEAIRGAKEELRRMLRSGVYKETQDQASLTARIDIEEGLANCRWFRKFHKVVIDRLNYAT